MRRYGQSGQTIPADPAPASASPSYDFCNIEKCISPHDYAELRNALRRYQMKKPRLGIPRLITVEALPGFMSNGATSFPQELGLASPRGVISPDKDELSMYCACARTTRAEKTKTIAKSLSLFML
jgi:hypothetical protein